MEGKSTIGRHVTEWRHTTTQDKCDRTKIYNSKEASVMEQKNENSEPQNIFTPLKD